MIYATFVLPAPYGCNLKCPFCAIAHRGEAVNNNLLPSDYIRFLIDVLVHFKIGRVCIQGYEPLLQESYPLTKRLLQIADLFLCETGLTTNGINLRKYAKELAGLVDVVAISIDSASSKIHDKLRGVEGSFEKTIDGIRTLRPIFSGRISVNSILFPNKAHFLEGMPELLKDMGVSNWSITPVVDFKHGRFIPKIEFIQATMPMLMESASLHGIEVYLSDELGALGINRHLYKNASVQTFDVDDRVFRLSPDSSCSRGKENLKESSVVPLWDRKTQPHLFLEAIFQESKQPIEKRNKFIRRFLSNFIAT